MCDDGTRDLIRSVTAAGPVLHSAPGEFRSAVIFLGGLGTTKEKLAFGRRRKVFEEAGHAVVLADHYNEGERRDKILEPEANRAGWQRNQRDLFWRAIHATAVGIPLLVDFAEACFGATVEVFAYGASMGGDIFLSSLLQERRLLAVCLERATPDWLRPNSEANALDAQCAAGDALYLQNCPCNRVEEYVEHPTDVLFLCGEDDNHVPMASATGFANALRQRRAELSPPAGNHGAHGTRGGRRGRLELCALPSGGWHGHVLVDAADATSRALAFFAAAAESLPAAASCPATASCPADPDQPTAAAHPAARSVPLESVPAVTTATELNALLRAPDVHPWLCVWATADWCTPCKRLQPGWRSLAEPDGDSHAAFAGKVTFAVADLTQEAEESASDGSTLSEVLSITTLPTFVLFHTPSGRESARAEGAAHKRPARRLFMMLKETVT